MLLRVTNALVFLLCVAGVLAMLGSERFAGFYQAARPHFVNAAIAVAAVYTVLGFVMMYRGFRAEAGERSIWAHFGGQVEPSLQTVRTARRVMPVFAATFWVCVIGGAMEGETGGVVLFVMFAGACLATLVNIALIVYEWLLARESRAA